MACRNPQGVINELCTGQIGATITLACDAQQRTVTPIPAPESLIFRTRPQFFAISLLLSLSRAVVLGIVHLRPQLSGNQAGREDAVGRTHTNNPHLRAILDGQMLTGKSKKKDRHDECLHSALGYRGATGDLYQRRVFYYCIPWFGRFGRTCKPILAPGPKPAAGINESSA